MKPNIVFTLFLTFMFTVNICAQDTIMFNLQVHVENYVANIPEEFTDEFSNPTNLESALWDSLLTYVYTDKLDSAELIAQQVDYSLIIAVDTISTDSLIMLARQADGPHWGLFVFNKNACRADLIFMAPHPVKDLNTGLEASYCFLNTNASWLMISGTNRCNSTTLSSCSGTTSTCGSSEKYRISDLAHNEASIFQTTVGSLLSLMQNPYFLQFHGFSKQSTDPFIIWSNGTRVEPDFDPIEEISRFLTIIDTSLTHKIAHLDLSWNRLIGFFNTNGRLINNSVAPCSQNADTTLGRFLHIEQEYHKLRKNSTGWDKMAHAVRAAFPSQNCPSTPPLVDNNIWYVKPGTFGDGKNWNSPHGNLRDIVLLADSQDSIFMTEGDYTVHKSRSDYSIDIFHSVSIFGGFPINGGTFNERNPSIFISSISGESGIPNDSSDNTNQLIKIHKLDHNTEFDGFQISQGFNGNNASILICSPFDPWELKLININIYRE